MTLRLNKVTINSHWKRIVDEVSLSIKEGEWYALVGQSGSGKSLLSQSIGQMLDPSLQLKGDIIFNNRNLMSLSKKEIRQVRGKEIAYIFQDYQGSFSPFRTIGQHFDEYQKTHGIRSKKERKAKALEALQSVGLEEAMFARYPASLSGGQLQRASIALAMLLSPRLVIADEITTALDSVSGHRILQLLARRQKETGCAILFITHDWRHVRHYADLIAVMQNGRIIESGSKHRILDHHKHEYTRKLINAAPTLGNLLPSGLPEVSNYE